MKIRVPWLDLNWSPPTYWTDALTPELQRNPGKTKLD